MSEETVDLNLPKIRIAKLYRLREKIGPHILRHVGVTADHTTVASIVAGISYLFKAKAFTRTCLDTFRPDVFNALSNSVSSLILGQRLEKDYAAQVILRLAGSHEKIVAGVAISRWVTPLLAEEWVAVNVKDIELTKLGRQGKTAGIFTMQVLSGSPAGETITGIFWAAMFSTMLRKLGMRAEDVSILTYRNLVHAKFAVLLTTDDPPRVKMYKEIPSLNKLNKIFHKARGLDRTCPNGYTWSCADCYVGYDKCPIGTHPNTFVSKSCPVCRGQGWFDPKLTTQTICLDCQVKKKMTRTK